MNTTKWARKLSAKEIPTETMMISLAEALESSNVSLDAPVRAALEAAAAAHPGLLFPVLARRPYGFEIDPDEAYPFWLSLLGFPVNSPTQPQVACARLCATECLHQAVKLEEFLAGSGLSNEEKALIRKKPGLVDREKIRTTSAGLYIKVTKGSGGDRKWALNNFPIGESVDAVAEYARLVREGKVEL